MILAAGRGERMRPLTDQIPKPLLKAGGRALIEYQLLNLARAGFADIVINHAYLGGIANALPLLAGSSGDWPFLVVNADIYCNMDYASLLPVLHAMQSGISQSWAHLVLIDNPPHHPAGDFALQHGRLSLAGIERLTFSGIGLYQPQLFHAIEPGAAVKLAPILRQAIPAGKVSGQYFSGQWIDVGTPERLKLLDQQLQDGKETLVP